VFIAFTIFIGYGTFAKPHPEEVYNPKPEVNDPPKFESINVDFPVKEGNLPKIDTDEPRTCTRVVVSINFLVTDPDEDWVTITADIDGDDKFDDFKKKTKSGKVVTLKRTFDTEGEYWIKYRACDIKGLCTSVLKFKIKSILCPPKIVEFATATERIGVGDEVSMSLRSWDAQSDKVRYEIDWDDDGVFEHVTAYYPPQKKVKVKHAFNEPGAHVISARSCDKFDGCSDVQRRTVNVKVE